MQLLALFFAILVGFSMGFSPSHGLAQGCPGAERSDLPPCCTTFTVPSGGSDEDRTCVGPASSYQFTIYQFGFEDSSGALHMFGSDQAFDAASVSAGASVGSYMSGQTLPVGTYTHMRPTISKDFTVTANITTQDARECSGTAVGLDGTEDMETCDPVTFRKTTSCEGEEGCGGDNCILGERQYIRDNQLGTFTINEGDALSLNFAFYVESAAKCVFPAGGTGDGTLSVGPLHVQITRN